MRSTSSNSRVLFLLPALAAVAVSLLLLRRLLPELDVTCRLFQDHRLVEGGSVG